MGGRDEWDVMLDHAADERRRLGRRKVDPSEGGLLKRASRPGDSIYYLLMIVMLSNVLNVLCFSKSRNYTCIDIMHDMCTTRGSRKRKIERSKQTKSGISHVQ